MTIEYTNNGNGTSTVTITRTANTEKVQSLLEDSAKFRYINEQKFLVPVNANATPIVYKTFDELTNAEKLEVIEKQFIFDIRLGASARNINVQTEAARATAIVENADNYGI